MKVLVGNGRAEDDLVAAFRAVPDLVYRDDSVWAPQSESAVSECLDRVRAGAIEAELVVVMLGADPLARVMGILDPAAPHGEGWVALFECLPGSEDAGVAALQRAREWLTGRGAIRAVGPRSDSLRAGLLLEGFDQPHTVFTAHNPAFYQSVFESAGFEERTRMDSFVFRRDRAPTFRGLPTANLVIRHPDPSRVGEELAAIEAFQGAVFAGGVGHVSRNDRASRRLLEQLLPILDLDLVVLAEDRQGELVGLLVCLPDVWQPPPIDRARLVSVGVAPGWRGKRVAMAMGAELATTLLAKGYQMLEGSWVMRDNRRPQVLARALGAEPGREFGLFSSDLRR